MPCSVYFLVCSRPYCKVNGYCVVRPQPLFVWAAHAPNAFQVVTLLDMKSRLLAGLSCTVAVCNTMYATRPFVFSLWPGQEVSSHLRE
jgi:hypothetical protein